MLMRSFKFAALIIFLAAAGAAAGSGDNSLIFGSAAYPLEISVSPETAPGAVLYETPFSEIPSQDYDTILIQGEMPDPGVQLQVRIKNGAAFKTYDKTAIHRFPGGRFWAKYKMGRRTGEPVKLALLNAGVSLRHTFTIYGAEAFRETLVKEIISAPAPAAYKPDPGFYLPAEMPFTVVRRGAWQAAPPSEPYTPHAPKIFTLHNTAGHYPKNYDEAVREMQFLQDYHQNGRGWIDLGYHFVIDPQGDIFEGRPVNVVGAHVRGRNDGNIGISVMGNYHPPVSQKPTKETLYTFVEMGKYLKTAYNIDISSFYAHRDIGNTDCPGDELHALMPELKSLIFAPAAPLPGPVLPLSVAIPPMNRPSLRQLLQSAE
ncbi:MAG: hypothetical protein A2X28_02225 [Elusimicrobia bacterium GWA2_56_46]|nr:MAG: hypothetical protein A2X28_02225 [Elusimicrobia bacterium GWA2_56_46]OGR55417.1 MAG: hypothetical protein A2X39_00740 [Elusimicrobia bacterium GWC2_56_31]HBB66369.1 hypothetical protein [Elusimicrobiota bacterium]HBW21880.1 hypothetical protein [Elusimicrobiota bacterium]